MKLHRINVPSFLLSQVNKPAKDGSVPTHRYVLKNNIAAAIDAFFDNDPPMLDCMILCGQEKLANGDYRIFVCVPGRRDENDNDAVCIGTDLANMPPFLIEGRPRGFIDILERVWDKLMALK